jgi:opacity protein-like surface antigen
MRIKAAVLAATLCMFAGSAYAGNTWFGATGGLGFPTGDYGDVAATGWNIGATGTHMVNDNWGFGGDLGMHRWGGSDELNDSVELAFGPGSEWNWSAIQATGHAMYRFPTTGSARPFVRAGLGIYSLSAKLETPSGDDSDSQSEVGFNIGGGMNFLTQGNMMWGFDGTYHIVNTDGSDVNNFNLGLHVMWRTGR